MKKFLLSLFLSLIISNVSFAEIITEENTFDNSQIIASVVNTEKKDYDESVPREIIFKKLTSNPPIYSLAIINQYTLRNFYLSVEPIKIKLNNSLEDIYYVQGDKSNSGSRTQLAFILPNEMIPNLALAETVQIQIPIYTSYKTHVKYTDFTVPQPILDEWKQVIAME